MNFTPHKTGQRDPITPAERSKQENDIRAWQNDRDEWRDWMVDMKFKFSRMYATPFDRVAAEGRNPNYAKGGSSLKPLATRQNEA